SSFDLENRIGILSFMKSQLLKIFSNCQNGKVLIMTHDLQTFYDLEKMMKEITNAVILIFGKNSCNYCLRELSQQALVIFKEEKRNEYSTLLSTVYSFASGASKEYDIAIGNIMRRALEAFSTFEYRRGMDEISCDETILSSMGNQIYHDYFQNLMYRLILNGESHMYERIKSLSDPSFASYMTYEAKQKTAKDILCLIYLLNRAHIEAHLSSIPEAMIYIEKWCDDIIERNKI
ncbi:MAG: AAA family ATPase, partial [Eubacteriales bacterium]|nr:AAA family ATPase [Eubacteriales bacterium]